MEPTILQKPTQSVDDGVMHQRLRPLPLGAITLIVIPVKPRTHTTRPMATRTLAVRPPQTTRTLQTVPSTKGEQIVRVGEVEMTLPIPWDHSSPPTRNRPLRRQPIHQTTPCIPMRADRVKS